ncbi:MAG: hypothetical protein GY841_16875 [FCB group bacterium]|nr:hypothetical protein [FCB group bacterium]
MECNEPENFLLLSDYFTGHLDPEDINRIESHLGDCQFCRLSLRAMLLIAGKKELPSHLLEEQHYSPQLLGRFYAEPQSLDKRLIEQIESHLAICPECAEDIAFLKNSNLDLVQLLQTRRKQSSWKVILERLKGLIGIGKN